VNSWGVHLQVYFHLFSGDSAGESILNCSRDKGRDLQMFQMGWVSIKILPGQKALQGQKKGSYQKHRLRIKMSRISHFNRHLLRMAWCLSSSFFIFGM